MWSGFAFALFFSLRPHPALRLLSRRIFQSINNAERCWEINTIQTIYLFWDAFYTESQVN